MIAESLRDVHLPSGTDIELFETKKESRVLALVDGNPDVMEFSSDSGVCLRLHKDGKEGLAVFRGPRTLVSKEIEKALFYTKWTGADSFRTFSSPCEKVTSAFPYDQQIFSVSSDQIFWRLKELQAGILRQDPRLKKVLKLYFEEERDEKNIINSLGQDVKGVSTRTSLMGEVLAEEHGQVEVGWDHDTHRFGDDLAWNDWGRALADQTLQMLGAKPVPMGFYPALIHPRVGTQLLGLLSSALSAQTVQLGHSFLKDALGEMVASDCVTIVDNPAYLTGVASAPVDDEGVPTEKIDLVSAGVLKEFFHNLRTSGRWKRPSNGHGFKRTLESAPLPGPTNFFLQQGVSVVSEMLEMYEQILFIKEVMGLHMADSVTGEFSLGATGELYSHGKLQQAVRGVTVSGTLTELLRTIVAVGDKVQWRGCYGAPPFLVSRLKVGAA